jgi:hypothetical protein
MRTEREGGGTRRGAERKERFREVERKVERKK